MNYFFTDYKWTMQIQMLILTKNGESLSKVKNQILKCFEDMVVN